MCSSLSITEVDFNDVVWFSNNFNLDSFLKGISFQKENERQDKQTIFIGDYGTDYIAISINKAHVEGINIRIDSRINMFIYLDKVTTLLNDNSLMIVDDLLNVIDLAPITLTATISDDIRTKNNFSRRLLNFVYIYLYSYRLLLFKSSHGNNPIGRILFLLSQV